MKLFDLSLKLNNYPIEKAKKQLSQIQQNIKGDYPKYLKEAKSSILKHHKENNIFYRNLTDGNNCEDWEDIPVLKKQHLQRPLNERLSEGYNKSSVYINKTSGSSGDPFYFAKDKFCHALTWAVIQDRFSWYGLDFNKSLQARFYGIPLDKSGYLKERIKDSLSKRHRFSVFDLSNQALAEVLKRFKSTPFKYINGYTSAIVQFAKFLKNENIILKEVCPSLDYCVVTSEMLFEEDRKLLEKFLGVKVIKEYGASELDVIAFENEKGEWLINNETLFVEILDEQNKRVPKGKEGRVVITSLYNQAHPFIRYDIGDIGTISESSTTAKTILKKLIGRADDVIHLPSGKTSAGLTFYYVTKKVIGDEGNISEFIIEQHEIDAFRIIYVGNEVLSMDLKENIRKEVIAYLEPGINIQFERRNLIERSKSGKLKQFISYLNISK